VRERTGIPGIGEVKRGKHREVGQAARTAVLGNGELESSGVKVDDPEVKPLGKLVVRHYGVGEEILIVKERVDVLLEKRRAGLVVDADHTVDRLDDARWPDCHVRIRWIDATAEEVVAVRQARKVGP